MEALAEDRTLTLERSFRAPPEAVYRAWTDPEALPRWFGPAGFSCRTHRIDVRVGGEWVFDMEGHGLTFANRHRWTELVPPGEGGVGRIAFLMDGLDGRAPKQVTIALRREATGTRLRQVMVFPDLEDLALARSYDAEARGQETLGKLAAALGE